MLSKTELKELSSLQQKKYRDRRAAYLVEGERMVREALSAEARVAQVLYNDGAGDWVEKIASSIPCRKISAKDMQRLSSLKTPSSVIAVVEKETERHNIKWDVPHYIYLDRIRDPGNMGTILRIADWYGLDQILISPDCVERFNQKVIQSSMGAVFRVQSIIISPEELISQSQEKGYPLLAASMQGESIHELKAPPKAVLLMGNEGQGLSNMMMDACQQKVSIPGYGQAESLNVGVATGILCDWLHR